MRLNFVQISSAQTILTTEGGFPVHMEMSVIHNMASRARAVPDGMEFRA